MTQIQSKTRRDMIEATGRLCQLLGLPRTTGQIYGLLYLSADPLSLDDMVELLGISKASASTGTRQLSAWGAVRQVWIQGDRRDFYEAVADLSLLLRGGYSEFVKPRLASSKRRLEDMTQTLDDELQAGLMTKEEYKLCSERIKNMMKMQKKMQQLAPLAEKIL